MRIPSVVLLLAAAPAAALTTVPSSPTNAFPPQSALVGVWEPTATSTGGIGEIVEFTETDEFIQTNGIVQNAFYRVIGDHLVTGKEPPRPDADSAGEPTFRVDGDSLAITGPDGSTTRLQRSGTAEAGQPPIVGVWTERRLGMTAYMRFGEDGRWEYRAAAASRKDCYALDGNIVTLTGSGRPVPSKMSVEVSGDRLVITGGDGRPNEFRRVARLWYDRDVENTAVKRRLDPKWRLEQAQSTLAASTGEARFAALPDAALLEAQVGSPEKAAALASELLHAAENDPTSWNSGNAVHKGNLALGLVALHSGNVAEAKSRLLAAGRTSGSPQLDSFGPNMVLAKELLEKGERDVVIEYFDLCRKFWKMDRGKLTEWTEQVRAGSIPDFGANLLY